MANKTPILRFSPTAWAKLLYFRDRQENEVGGFAVTSAGDLLKVEDFVTVKQDVTVASVAFDDQAVADFFDFQVDAGRKPEQFGRIWLHTHPGDSAEPSCTDEMTFARVFGSCQWAVMFIMARGGKTTARLRFNVGPSGQVLIPVEVDYSNAFGPTDHAAWHAEYEANVHSARIAGLLGTDVFGADDEFSYGHDLSSCSMPEDWLEELEAMEPAERRAILDELAVRPDLWDEEEVAYEF